MRLEPVADWHVPRFEEGLCAFGSDRERLGLPDRYVAGRLDAALAEAQRRFTGVGPAQLLATFESSSATLVERIAAGNLLALAGNPRIDPEAPEMIAIEGGEIGIGLPANEIEGVVDEYRVLGVTRAWISKECPRHSLRLPRYAIARYPVTNAEYRAFLLDTGHAELPSSWMFRRYPVERANHPVHTIPPESADAYAAWLATRTGRAFRLPREAEWELAAAGPEGREFPWGERFDADLANTAETGLFDTSPVGAFRGGESPFGLSDMAGNVEEYVADLYAPYPGGDAVDDHLNADGRVYRVARGGCFARFRDLARTRRRHGHNPRSPVYAMGFRLAETP
jgi:formylglycine-generating enzyme required for sulfatase activity